MEGRQCKGPSLPWDAGEPDFVILSVAESRIMPLSKSDDSVDKAQMVTVTSVSTGNTLPEQALYVKVEEPTINERPENKGLGERKINPAPKRSLGGEADIS